MKNKKAFTLIELIAVLVILAILALIVTPIVMNIISKAKDSANKRSIDAYGRSIELAIASHLIETGNFPTSIEELTIEYNGDEVVCETTQLNSDSSVYLAGCTVGGKRVEGYTYGKNNSSTSETTTYEAYSVGDEVTYKGMNFHVIKDSSVNQDYVTLLLDTPLTTTEINEYGGVGTENNHVNMYVTSDTNASYYHQAYDYNGIGYLAYYTSSTCGGGTYDGCTTSYEQSDIKYVVDAWALSKITAGDLKEVSGYKARIITYDELTDELGYEKASSGTIEPSSNGNTPSWVWDSENRYSYWTMSGKDDQNEYVWSVWIHGGLYATFLFDFGEHDVSQYGHGAVRPVINLLKSAI